MMFKSDPNTPKVEPMVSEHHHHLLCWKSTLAGLLISVMAFMILMALGIAVAGRTAETLISHEQGGSALATASGLWLGISAVIALFCGSYFALRISRFMTNKVGAAHGFVIASLFFILFTFGLGGLAGNVFSGLTKAAGASAAGLSSNISVQDSVNRTLGTQLKSPAAEVAQGLTARLMDGDTDSARSYLAYQTGLPQAEVDAKIAQLKNDFDQAAKAAGEKAAAAASDAGWMLFALYIVGVLGAMIGGRYGAQSNVVRPFAEQSTERSAPRARQMLASERGSALPYILGWLMGVPVSILFLIALLRTVF